MLNRDEETQLMRTAVGVFNEASFWAFSVGAKKYLER